MRNGRDMRFRDNEHQEISLKLVSKEFIQKIEKGLKEFENYLVAEFGR